LLPGMIIEDRGNLGPRRQRVVRVRSQVPDMEFDIEVPVNWLEAPPS
jgi:hypothetical protein